MSEDLGYFGPESVTWRVHAEPLTMVGGLRALLLQALHPAAMRVLYERSSFEQDPWTRLRRTAQFVATVSFAPREQVDEAAAHVRAVHERLGIDDDEQLAWVHACEVDSFLVAATAAGVALRPPDRDTYVAEQAQAARLVGVPDRLIPTSAGQLADYFARMRPELALTREALAGARVVIAPPLHVPSRWRVPARLGWTTVSSTAVGLLPSWARRMYRLPPVPGRTLAATATLRSLHLASRGVPERWREGPQYRAAKARAAI